MQRAFLNTLKSHRNLLLVGALLGGAAAGCDPKQIGDETAGKVDDGTTDGPVCQDGATKEAGDGCNTCVCESGAWACTLAACDETEGATSAGCDGKNCVEPDETTSAGCDGKNCVEPDETTSDPQQCDEGETKDAGDGCNTCICAEGQWACTEKACPDLPPEPNFCGNGVVEPEYSEACDDGNLEDGDGCSSNCLIPESGSLEACVEPIPNDPISLHHVAVAGDVLAVQLGYSAGCKKHEIAYCWNGAFAESDPVQIWTRIAHDANGEQCEAWEDRAIEFDLSDLKQAYQQAYQTQEGKIVIHLEGWPESVLYAF